MRVVGLAVADLRLASRSKSFGETFASKAELVAQMPSDYNPHEEDWGQPVGKEVW